MSAKRSFPLWIILINVLFLGLLSADPDLRVAVLDFRNLTQRPDLVYLEKAIPEIMVTDLSLCDKITLIERSRLQEILDEMHLALSGVVNEKQAVEIGELAGANAILVGSIISGGGVYRIDARLVDVASAEILIAEKKDWLSDYEIIRAVDELAEQIIRKLTGDEVIMNPDFDYEPLSVYDDHVLKLETALDQPVWLNGSGESVFLQVDIYSKEVPRRDRIPLNLALVIDRSGSMARERKLDYAKNSAKFIVQNMSDDDIVSLITYESKVQLIVPAQNAQNKRKIIGLIDDIETGGSTNLSGGMLEGYSQIAKNLKTGQVNRVLLLSDGLANEGVTRADKLQEICYDKSIQGMSISTFGVGADYDEDLLLGLAELGVGNYYFIHSPEEIPTIFASEMSGLLAIAAQNVKIQIQTAPGIKVLDVFGYLSETNENQTQVSIGDIFSNDHYSITFELQLPKTIADSLQVANVVLQYDDVVNKGNRVHSNSPVLIQSTSKPERRDYYRNPYVGERLTLLNTTLQIQSIVQRADESNLGEIQQSLAKQAIQVACSAKEYKSPDLKKQILTIHKYSQQFADVEKKEIEYNKYGNTALETSSSTDDLQIMKKAAKYNSYLMQKRDIQETIVFEKPKEEVKKDPPGPNPSPKPNPDFPDPIFFPTPTPIPDPNLNLPIREKPSSEPEKISTETERKEVKPLPKPDELKKRDDSERKEIKPQPEPQKTKPKPSIKPQPEPPKTEPGPKPAPEKTDSPGNKTTEEPEKPKPDK
ncbi:VWA domain-containing protein [bacterium]|nr:VWA domain-containing protein [bacterium]MBU1063646.1 VWA domain-containing protein [bacterium]MBU1633718.1 VWA domain-containing protein [bacterium]MBU1875140.1 VWA domain-containing protein [bacterium]